MATVKERMLEAQQLIKAKDYEGARAILKKVKHPKAAEWLTRLDELAPVKPARRWWLWALVAVVLLLVMGVGVVGLIYINNASTSGRLSARMTSYCLNVYTETHSTENFNKCDAWVNDVLISQQSTVVACDQRSNGLDKPFADCLYDEYILPPGISKTR